MEKPHLLFPPGFKPILGRNPAVYNIKNAGAILAAALENIFILGGAQQAHEGSIYV
ncbi:hypothetical protein ISS30_03300 [bacterium]|nr:hypothetical protein [bacterium]